MKILIASLALCLISVGAMAKGGGGGGFLMGFNVVPTSTTLKETTPGTDDTKQSSMDYDVMLGYSFGGLYLGGIMGSTSMSTGGTFTAKRSLSGLSLGLSKGAFLGMLHYFATTSTNGDVEPEIYNGGTGTGVDFGYLIPLSASFAIGANIQYRSMTSKKYDSAGTGTFVDTDRTATWYRPALSFAFIF